MRTLITVLAALILLSGCATTEERYVGGKLIGAELCGPHECQ